MHLNLRDEVRPWRHVVGAVLLDKLAPRVRTVVNKRGELRGPFRTFDAEARGGIGEGEGKKAPCSLPHHSVFAPQLPPLLLQVVSDTSASARAAAGRGAHVRGDCLRERCA